MVLQVIATITGNNIQVVMSFRPHFTRFNQGTLKLIVWISDVISCKITAQLVHKVEVDNNFEFLSTFYP
jgi:hypothetical protein